MKTSAEVFQALDGKNTQRVIEAEPGHPLYITANTSEIIVASDPEPFSYSGETKDGLYYFRAFIKHGFIRYDIHAYDHQSGRRYPGLFSKELTEQSISYFQQQENEVLGIRARWNIFPGISDNYEQYTDARNRGDKPETAAIKTWTGKLAVQHGFHHIYHVPSEIDDNYIDFLFSKKHIWIPWFV